MNLILLISAVIISLFITFITNKYMGKLGIIALYTISNLVAFILSFKLINISHLNFISNTLVYVMMLTMLYLLLERKEISEVKKIINFTFFINIFSSMMLYITSSYTQSLTDTIGINMTNVFINNYRILLAYPISQFVSQKILIYVYDRIKKIYDNLFISTVTTYLLIGLIEILLFSIVAYYNILRNKVIIEIILSTYMIRLIITVIYSLLLPIFLKKAKKVIKWTT